MRKRTVLPTLAIAAVAYVAMLPPLPAVVPASDMTSGPRGAIHIHTSRSDGAGDPDDVAAAAAAAGLQFVILTDHGDGTRVPDPPRYASGVLVIDAVEVSTASGHVVALGLMESTPYPLGGEARDVVDDIHRLGGVAIAAHPWSPRRQLRWTDRAAAIDGLEWINADSEWRDESVLTLARALLAYPIRSVAAVGRLMDRPERVIGMWDELLRTRRATAVAAVDAHARVGVDEPYDTRIALRLPAYETMFRTMTIVLDSVAFSGDAVLDAAAVVTALRNGSVFSVIDALASPGAVRVAAASGSRVASPGGTLPLNGPVTIRVDAVAPPDAVVALIKDGDGHQSGRGPVLEETLPPEPAVYRVEIRLPSAPGRPPVPWIMSNPIYVGWAGGANTEAGKSNGASPATVLKVLFEDEPVTKGRVERSPDSQAALDVVPAVSGHELLFRYALGGRRSDSPYAGVLIPLDGAGSHDRVLVTARADRPMRLNVQLRVPNGGLGERWSRSVYVDETPRAIEIVFADMRPLPGARDNKIPLDSVESLLFVVDAVHTSLGTNGRVWLDDLKLGKE